MTRDELNRRADALEMNGLRYEEQALRDALNGIGKDDYLEFFGIDDDSADEEWQAHIDCLIGMVNQLKEKIAELRNEAKRAAE